MKNAWGILSVIVMFWGVGAGAVHAVDGVVGVGCDTHRPPSSVAPGGGCGGQRPLAPEAPVQPDLPAAPVDPGEGGGRGGVGEGGGGAPADLVKAGNKGNPGFQYQIKKDRSISGCQATRLKVGDDKGPVCMAATAAHCFIERGDANTKSGKAKITTGDLGEIDAEWEANPVYNSGKPGGTTRDSAIFKWKCTGKEKAMPALKISTKKLTEMDEVFYGKVMSREGKPGFYRGEVRREQGVVGIDGQKIGQSTEGIHEFGDKIEQGDSGGPLICKAGTDKKELELCGVLSSRTQGGTGRANYSTNESLDFIREQVKAAEPKSIADSK